MTRMAEVPYSGGSDHIVFLDPAFGVPCPMLIQWPDRYYHSSHDTPDKCDPRSLALAVRCAATYAASLAHMGDPERGWLLEAVRRGSQRRLLDSFDAEDPAWALARERLRGIAALRSLSRLGLETPLLERECRALDEFARAHGGEPVSGPRAGAGSVRPRRLLEAPLHSQRHLLEGFDALPSVTRERWRRREELWHGNRELLRNMVGLEGLFAWTVRSYIRHKHEIPSALACNPHLRMVRLRSTADAAAFLRGASSHAQGQSPDGSTTDTR